MPNTDPVVDEADVLRGLRERAEREAEVPVGFFAAITREQHGVELTEMGELADAGAVGFTDDGRPVVAAGVMRRALQYSTITRRAIAVHCEEPTLTTADTRTAARSPPSSVSARGPRWAKASWSPATSPSPKRSGGRST